MTQVALARAIGVNAGQVQKYETGANRVSASRLWQIAQVLDEPFDAFFPLRFSAAIRVDPLGPDEAEGLAFARMVQGMKPDQRSAFLKLTRTFGLDRRQPLGRVRGSLALRHQE